MSEVVSGSTTSTGSEASPGAELSTETVDSQEAAPQDGAAPKADLKKVPESDEDLSEEYLDRKVTITIDGEKHRMSVREAIKLQQLEKVSRQKMSSASQMETKVRALLNKLDDPREYFKAKGIDPADFAEATLKQQLQYLQETPEQKELRELREEKAERSAREQAEKSQREKQEMSQKEQMAQEGFNKEFIEAWQNTGLPPDRLYGQLLAAEMVSANARGEDLQWKEAAVKVKSKLFSTVSQTLSKLDAEAIQEMLGKDVLKKIREFEVKRLSSGTTQDRDASLRPVDSTASKRQAPKKLNERQWEEWWSK